MLKPDKCSCSPKIQLRWDTPVIMAFNKSSSCFLKSKVTNTPATLPSIVPTSILDESFLGVK